MTLLLKSILCLEPRSWNHGNRKQCHKNDNNRNWYTKTISMFFFIGSDMTISKYIFSVNQTCIWLITLEETGFCPIRDHAKSPRQIKNATQMKIYLYNIESKNLNLILRSLLIRLHLVMYRSFLIAHFRMLYFPYSYVAEKIYYLIRITTCPSDSFWIHCGQYGFDCVFCQLYNWIVASFEGE